MTSPRGPGEGVPEPLTETKIQEFLSWIHTNVLAGVFTDGLVYGPKIIPMLVQVIEQRDAKIADLEKTLLAANVVDTCGSLMCPYEVKLKVAEEKIACLEAAGDALADAHADQAAMPDDSATKAWRREREAGGRRK